MLQHKWHVQCRLIAALTLPHLFETCARAESGRALAQRILMAGLTAVVEATMDVRVAVPRLDV